MLLGEISVIFVCFIVQVMVQDVISDNSFSQKNKFVNMRLTY